ncbi:MAG: hypothetical protein AB7S77_12495 [Desulfatirhabdiaceae bacterium]
MSEDCTPKKQIGSILQNLMHSSRFARDKGESAIPHGMLPTSFGVPLIEQDDGRFIIDMTPVRVFAGLHAFVGYLAKQVMEECHHSTVDILTRVMVDDENTRELAALGVTHVVIYARRSVVRYLIDAPEELLQNLRLVFDALANPKWGGVLFPRAFGQRTEPSSGLVEDEKLAMLFPFHMSGSGAHGYFMLLEHDPDGRFLRITIEDGAQSRLFLKRIPHRVVSDIRRHHYNQDIQTMADQILSGIHRECQNQQNEYMEIPGRQAALFDVLATAGLSGVTGVMFRWTRELAEELLMGDSLPVITLLSKILILLEDTKVNQVLSLGSLIEMMDGDTRVYLDLSRKGAILNLSIGQRRKQPDMQYHLCRMPYLLASHRQAIRDSLENFRIVFIHHSTSEVLGFVKALDESRVAFLTTLFIRYQGIVPGFHLEDMMSMPARRFSFHALQRIEMRDSVEGAYILSRQYSSLTGLGGLDEALRSLQGNYLASMCLAAGHLFFREAIAAKSSGQKLILVEDGGYLAPVLNQQCHQSRSVGDTLKQYAVEPGPDTPLDMPLQTWLSDILPATFEHTANGYYHLRDVEKNCGGLIFPAFTIATSRYKNIVEAESCAGSILTAVESIFNGLGKSIMHRHTLILGSRGNIGGFLLKAMVDRASYGSVCGIDIKITAQPNTDVPEFCCIADMPDEHWKRLDLFLGITGVSVLKRDFWERLILEGRASDIFLASGSTKTVEFMDLTEWIEELSASKNPAVGGYPVRLEHAPIKDPQNRILQGHHIRICFEKGPTGFEEQSVSCKNLYLLGDSMPINFLYYGVPGEVIDGVFEELYCLLTGFVTRYEAGRSYAPGIYALDVNIDKHGETD